MPRPNVYRRDLEKRSFQKGVPVIVKRSFTAAGRAWAPGEPFPWQTFPEPRRGTMVDKVEALFRTGHLRHAEPPEIEALGLSTEPSPAPKKAKGEVLAEPEAQELLADLAPEAMTIRQLRIVAKHIGAPIKRTRDLQLAAVMDALEAEGA